MKVRHYVGLLFVALVALKAAGVSSLGWGWTIGIPTIALFAPIIAAIGVVGLAIVVTLVLAGLVLVGAVLAS